MTSRCVLPRLAVDGFCGWGPPAHCIRNEKWKRRLGQSSLEVSPITFGCNVFGWTADEKTSFVLLDAWLDAGFSFLDTADVYRAGILEMAAASLR